jgi:hypothetical protein
MLCRHFDVNCHPISSSTLLISSEGILEIFSHCGGVCRFSTGVSMGLRPTEEDENGSCSDYCPSKHRPPLCHPDRSAAQWRDLRLNGPFLEVFFDRGIMGLRPTQGDEKRLLFSNYSPWKRHLSACHPERSAAQWRDLRFSGSFVESVFSTERSEVARSAVSVWGTAGD